MNKRQLKYMQENTKLISLILLFLDFLNDETKEKKY